MVFFPSWPTSPLEPSRRLGRTEFEHVCAEAKWGCGGRKEEEKQEREWPGSICPVMLEESECLLLPGHPESWPPLFQLEALSDSTGLT